MDMEALVTLYHQLPRKTSEIPLWACKSPSADAPPFSRIGLRVVGHSGLVADQKLAKKRVEVLLKELAAVVR
eukprot:1316026-Pleurochrysis_carterae.AAC.1